MKRITISLDDDLYRIAKAYAQSEDISLSKAVVRMMRRGMEGRESRPVREEGSGYRTRDPRTGLMVVDFGKPITTADVRRAEDDEDLRYLEPMGSGEE